MSLAASPQAASASSRMVRPSVRYASFDSTLDGLRRVDSLSVPSCRPTRTSRPQITSEFAHPSGTAGCPCGEVVMSPERASVSK